MRHAFVFMGILALFVLPGTTQAAQAILNVHGVEHTIRTGSAGGQCTVTDLGASGIEVECVDGANRAKANSIQGCVFIQGSGLCAMGADVDPGLKGSIQLSCDNGAKYNVSTGDNGGSCSVTGTGPNKGVSCESTQQNGTLNKADASCSTGCTYTSGSGCCCQEGTSGCGAGNNCTGK